MTVEMLALSFGTAYSQSFFLGRGDVADSLGDVLNVGRGHLTAVVLVKIRRHRTHVELRVLVTELAGEARRGPADDPPLVLQRAVDPPAARALVDVALHAHDPVRALIVLGITPACSPLHRPEAKRAAVGVETRQRLPGGTTAHCVARLLDRPFYLQQRALKIHCDLNRHLRPRPSGHFRHADALSSFYKRVQTTPRISLMTWPHPISPGRALELQE